MQVTLAKSYKEQDPAGWLMSEKLDGVRAIWNGHCFKSRNGNTFPAPVSFTESLPKNCILDGELWHERGQFQSTAGVVRAGSNDWRGLRFMVFDSVSPGNFQARLAFIRALTLPPHCQIVVQTACKSRAHLDDFERDIIALNGEGVMIRNPKAEYEHKRSGALLKLKRFYCDEARVLEHIPGTGKHAGQLGALVCEWHQKIFNIGSGFVDAVRDAPPALGSLVTFKYCDTTTAGIPRHASFVGVRDYE